LRRRERQLELLARGQISVVELAEAHIRQIERLNPELNAFADFDAERVRARARKLDAWRGSRAAVVRIAGDGQVFDCHAGY
jgi:Asp-tRNA(Asn)/Glu-tRNA(Gln) amidotransferase A subunit family amidase